MSKSASGEADRRSVSSRKDLSAEWLRERYHGDGLTLRQVGKCAGFSMQTIRRRMAECDVERRDSGKPSADERLQSESWFREMYEERGYSAADIAEICDCSRPTAQKWKREHGIESIGAYKSRGEGEENPNGGEWVTTECYICDAELELPIRRIERAEANVCSEACRSEYMQTVAMAPGESHPLYINGEGNDYGPNWPQIRETAIQRDNERCQGCGVSRDKYHMDLDVHHITPFRKFDDHERANRMDNLVTLCRPCHRQYEGLGIRPVYIDD